MKLRQKHQLNRKFHPYFSLGQASKQPDGQLATETGDSNIIFEPEKIFEAEH